jgi:hypothetical protein
LTKENKLPEGWKGENRSASVFIQEITLIADLGCPNSVISEEDKDLFIQNLSEFQQQNLVIVETDEKFKFGPSGPYSFKQKVKFCIRDEISFLWVEVALVKARIPMLLGNNILKPLAAKMNYFQGEMVF